MKKERINEKYEDDNQPKGFNADDLKLLVLIMSAIVALVLTLSIFVLFYIDLENIKIGFGEIIALTLSCVIIFTISYTSFSRKLRIEERQFAESLTIVENYLKRNSFTKVEYVHPLDEILTEDIIEKGPEFYARICGDIIEVECRDSNGNHLNQGSTFQSYHSFVRNFRFIV